jgi:signal transduction histidine kinase
MWKKEWFVLESQRNSRKFLTYISTIFIGLTLLTVVLLLNTNVTSSAYPFRNIARPYDLLPLALYVFCAFYLFPKFYKQHPSVFAQTLLLSLIPAIVTQLYMSFGSRELFDNSFNIAHFLTAFTYFIPFIGLGFNYLQSHKNEKRIINELHREAAEKQKAVRKLMESEKLSVTGKLARTIAHEVRNPLTNINMSLEQLEQSIEDKESAKLYMDIIKRSSDRIKQLITELLNISRPAALNMKNESVNKVLEETVQLANDRF